MSPSPSLSGIRVLEIGEGWPAALCGKLFVDLGADVSRVEVPWSSRLEDYGRSDVERRVAAALPNAAKQRLIGEDARPTALQPMMYDVDVVIAEMHVVERLGLDIEDVGAHTVVCRLSPFGPEGPLADHVASDLTLQAMSGVMASTGLPDGPPLRAGTELSAAVGALYAVIGTVAALIERERSSQGQIVDVSLYECLVSTLTNFASRVLGGVEPLGRIGNQGPNSAPWELFTSEDDQYVFIIAGSDPTFERLTSAMGRPELPTDPRFDTPHNRRDHAEEITAIVAEWAASLPRVELVATLRDAGVPVSPVARMSEVLEDEHLESRGMLVRTVDESGAELPVAGAPLGFSSAQRDPVAGKSVRDAPLDDPASSVRERALAGIRVVDFGTLTAGPFCARLLANLGADVLKIEPLRGETGRHSLPIVADQSVYFHITNNSKRAISVNLRDPDDVTLVSEIIRNADVVIENQAPGALTKRGLGAEDQLAAAPHLVYTSVSGYGHDGALGGLRAYDTVIQAGAGLMSLTGEAGGHPLKTGISAADVLGSLAATTGTLAAVYGRLTGRHEGIRLDVALYDAMAWSTQMAWATELAGLGGVERMGNGHWLYAPHGVHPTADGSLVAIACETDEQWGQLVVVLSETATKAPEGLENWSRAQRWERRELLEELVAAYCASNDREEVVKQLQAHHVPVAPVHEVKEVFTDQQAVVSTTVEVVLDTGEPLSVTDVPFRLSATPAMVRGRGPGLGEDDDAVRGDPGRAWERVFGDDG